MAIHLVVKERSTGSTKKNNLAILKKVLTGNLNFSLLYARCRQLQLVA